MKKIAKFYLNKASYIAVDEQGMEIELEVDYWNSSFTISTENQDLQIYATKLLRNKHRVNFVHKMREK